MVARCSSLRASNQAGQRAGDVLSRDLEVPYWLLSFAELCELFIDDDGLIAEWIYRRGGATTPTRMSTWEDHRRLGPLLVSLDHQGPDGFRVWFSDVALMLRNGEDWLYPAN